MPAYVIADIKVADPVRYEEYKRLAAASVEKYGGRFLARGGKASRLEGAWTPSRLVILEFESYERAKQWYDSPDYQPARDLRHETATGSLVLVDGVPA
jgi:uncharacterized protein (DUF1330 family)